MKGIVKIKIKSRVKILKDSLLILSYTQAVSESFLNAYINLRKGKRGGTSDIEQDLLRAMLVFAAAGLDSMIKKLIKDVLKTAIDLNDEIKMQLENFTIQKLKTKDADLGQQILDIKFISSVITDHSPRNVLIKKWIEDLTSGSLQSKEELFKVAAAFAIKPEEIIENMKKIESVFKIRNQIVHEMDINLNAQNRKRFQRKASDMVDFTNAILNVAERFLLAVEKRLKS